MAGHISSQTSTFMALSGLAATNALLDDARPAWIWADDGMTVLWSNPAGAAFFGVESLTDLADLSGLARAPARPHIARVASSGPEDRDTTERLRFYRGLRVLLLTCTCRRLALPGGGTGALIVANDASAGRSGAIAATALVELMRGAGLGSVVLYDQDGTPVVHEGVMEPPSANDVRAQLTRAKHVPVRTVLEVGGAQHASEILTLESGQILVVTAADPVPQDDAPPQSAQPIDETGLLPVSAKTPAGAADPSSPASGRQPTRAGGLFAFASATRFLTPARTETGAERRDAIPQPLQSGSSDDASVGAHADQIDAPDPHTQDDADAQRTAAPAHPTNLDDATDTGQSLSGDDGSVASTLADDPTEQPAPDIEAIGAVDASRGSAPAFAFERRDRPVRFAWKMDVDRRFTFLSPDFAEVLGPQAADVVGMTWDDVADRFALDPDGRVASALTRRDTWSGRTVDWPVSGEALRVPVDMAALPAFDRFRVFEGFRGFGVCRTADAFDDPDATGLSLPDRIPTSASAPDVDDAEDVAEPDDATREVVAEDGPFSAAVDADVPAPTSDSTLSDEEITTVDALADDGNDEEANIPASEAVARAQMSEPPVSVKTLQVAGSDIEESDDITSADDNATSSALVEPTAADLFDGNDDGESIAHTNDPDAASDTALPSADDANNTPTEERVEEEDADRTLMPAAKQTALAASRLSKPDRDAFRKIAEALGARHEEGIVGNTDVRFADAQSETDGTRTETSDDSQDHREAIEPFEPGHVDLDTASADQEAETGFQAGPLPAARTATPRAARTGLLDRLPVGVAIVAGHDVGYANATLLDLLGFSTVEDLNTAGGLDALFAEPEEWPSAVAGTETERTMRLNLADGSTRPVKARLHSVPWNDGNALMMSLLDRHDPAQEAALDRLHEVQASLSSAETHIAEMDAVLETATDGVLLLDDAARILKVNRSAEALFNAIREDMVGEQLTTLLAPESHRDASDYFDGLTRNGVASVLNDGREVIGQVRGGGLIPLFMTIGRVGETEDGPRYCAVVRDITQWKTAEEELTDAKREAETASSKKSDFLAKISHEIRTPLNAIIGFSEVMMEERFGPIGNDRYKGYLRDIHNSGSHIMSLINDLLDLSKIEAGKLDLTFEAVSANDIIRECVALMQPQANRERVIIRASLPTSVPSIVADGRSIRQVVLNLLSNAIKFNQPGGQVIVSTALEDSGEVMLRVRDTGVGMSQKDLEAAMEPFRQVHTARHGGGTGLGLPLTKALVEANRASFRIDSELHQGTLVEVTFPPQRVLAE